MDDTAETAQVIVRPPLAWGLAVIAGFGLDWLVPLRFLPADLPAGWLGAMVFVLALALFALDELAEDQRRSLAELGTGAVTLAQNCRDVEEVEAVFQSAVEAGATCLKRPEKAAWGGTSGYFADPDGHVWEIAHNPFWPLTEDGALTLPRGSS